MSLWVAVLASSALVYSWKYLGYLIPAKFVSQPRIQQLATLLTVALLGALVGIQTIGSPEGVTFDARIPALMVAALLYFFRVPFIVVVLTASIAAALLRVIF